MKLVLSLSLFAVSAFAGEMTGYISDASCGARNANNSAASAECARACVKGGADPVFVSDKDQKVYKIADKQKVMAHVGHHVVLNGSVAGDIVTVASLKTAE